MRPKRVEPARGLHRRAQARVRAEGVEDGRRRHELQRGGGLEVLARRCARRATLARAQAAHLDAPEGAGEAPARSTMRSMPRCRRRGSATARAADGRARASSASAAATARRRLTRRRLTPPRSPAPRPAAPPRPAPPRRPRRGPPSGSGECTVSRTRPAAAAQQPARAPRRFTPASETGTTGTPASRPGTKLPRLNGRTAPSGLRVPSGKTTTLVPRADALGGPLQAARARNALPRSMPMCPPR